MMLSNRDLSKTLAKNGWLLLIIITVVFVGATSGAKNQTNLKKNSSTEAGVEAGNELQSITSDTALEVKEEPYSSVWSMMYDWWNWMIGGYAQNKNAVGEPRTFGAIRRLQMALIPIAFKLGIVFAMITAIFFLSLKAVFLLKLLLIMNAAAIFAKLLLAKSEHHYQPPPPPWAAYGGWNHAPAFPSWPIESAASNKEVHLHVHGNNLAHQPWERSDYVNGINANGLPIDAANNELSNRGPLPYLRSTQNQPNSYYVNGSG